MRNLLIRASVLLGVSLAGYGADLPLEQTGSASTMENITRFHKGCHSRADLSGGDCIAAAHRYCEFYSKNTFRFLAERAGMDVYVSCAQRAWLPTDSATSIETVIRHRGRGACA